MGVLLTIYVREEEAKVQGVMKMDIIEISGLCTV